MSEPVKIYCIYFDDFHKTGGEGWCRKFNQKCFTFLAEYLPRQCYHGQVILGEVKENDEEGYSRDTGEPDIREKR